MNAASSKTSFVTVAAFDTVLFAKSSKKNKGCVWATEIICGFSSIGMICPNLSTTRVCPVGEIASVKDGSTSLPSTINFVWYLWVTLSPEAACVFIKNAVAITGLPKLSNIVTDVEELKVSGLVGSKSSALSKTVDEAGRLTESAKFFVAFASPASNSNLSGAASEISPPWTDPSFDTGRASTNCPAESTTNLSLFTEKEPFLV